MRDVPAVNAVAVTKRYGALTALDGISMEVAQGEVYGVLGLFLGPAINYRQEKWWVTLSVLPQIYGANFSGDPDHDHHFELEGHERVNVRLIFGIRPRDTTLAATYSRRNTRSFTHDQ